MFSVEQMRGAAASIEGALHKLARFQDSFRVDRADHNVDRVLLETLELPELRDRQQFSIDEERVETLALGPARDVGMESLARFHQRRENLERAAFHRSLKLFHDRDQTLFFDRQIAIRAKLRSSFREEEAEEMIDLGHRGHGRFAAAARDALFDRDTRRHAFDEIDIRFLELLDELPRVRRHAVEETTLPFGEENIECDGGFPGPA